MGTMKSQKPKSKAKPTSSDVMKAKMAKLRAMQKSKK